VVHEEVNTKYCAFGKMLASTDNGRFSEENASVWPLVAALRQNADLYPGTYGKIPLQHAPSSVPAFRQYAVMMD
jgi:hypothetical protein